MKSRRRTRDSLKIKFIWKNFFNKYYSCIIRFQNNNSTKLNNYYIITLYIYKIKHRLYESFEQRITSLFIFHVIPLHSYDFSFNWYKFTCSRKRIPWIFHIFSKMYKRIKQFFNNCPILNYKNFRISFI